MSSLDLARWQFGITTVYHFLFVPITLGTVYLVAAMQTAWVRTGKDKYLQATKFFGKLFLINFAMGVVTGIVQEFQFGMNWSDYSRFVGDIFGAPLAVEALLTFFLESTFIGLWIFGWDRLPKKVHLATIWATAIGTSLSAYMILAANAFMQHPTGFEYSQANNRMQLTDFFAVLFQNTAYIAWFHTLSASFLVSGTLMCAVSAWLLMKGKGVEMARTTVRVGAIVAIAAGVAVSWTGDADMKIMVQQQPMKVAAAEALYQTQENAPFSVLAIGDLSGQEATNVIEIPGLLSFLATGTFNGPDSTVQGINDLQRQYQSKFARTLGADTNFVPYVPVTYWSFRFMIGLGMLGVLFGIWMLWLTRKDRIPVSSWVRRIAAVMPLLPLIGITFGWIFTEMGRQPWIVFGSMLTADGVSPTVTAGSIWISVIVFALLYGSLAVVEVGLFLRTVRQGPPEITSDPYQSDDADSDRPLTFAY
jgi:cytochrome d ubiquinol oxidase subunit I